MIASVFAFLAGLFCILAAVYDWDWFFENYKAKPFVALFGRDGARMFYGILGLIIIILGFSIFITAF